MKVRNSPFSTNNPNRILYMATCEKLSDAPVPDWEVRVEGQEPYAHVRTYTVAARDDNTAVRQAVSDFMSEMECMDVGAE